MSKELIGIIKKISLDAVEAGKPADILFGTVEAIAPLVISVDQKLKLSGEHILLTRGVTDYETEISFDDPGVRQRAVTRDMEEQTVSAPYKISFTEKTRHRVTVYSGLKAGDRVALLRASGGQKYIVLDRLVN